MAGGRSKTASKPQAGRVIFWRAPIAAICELGEYEDNTCSSHAAAAGVETRRGICVLLTAVTHSVCRWDMTPDVRHI